MFLGVRFHSIPTKTDFVLTELNLAHHCFCNYLGDLPGAPEGVEGPTYPHQHQHLLQERVTDRTKLILQKYNLFYRTQASAKIIYLKKLVKKQTIICLLTKNPIQIAKVAIINV